MIHQTQIDEIRAQIEALEEQAREKLRSILPAPEFAGITRIHVDGTDWLIGLTKDGRVFQHREAGWEELSFALLPGKTKEN